MNSLPVYVLESLTFDVYIIGYKLQGESIILIVKSDGDVRFIGVIDSFEYNGINKTMEVLDSLNVSNVNMVCWSHPDVDHSFGIDTILSKYANKYTKVFVPEYLNGDIENYGYNDRVKETFELINEKNIYIDSDSFYPMTVSDSKNLVSYPYEYTKMRKVYTLDINSLAPSSNLIRKRILKKSKLKKNDYSIVLLVKFGELQLLFSSDVENNNIDHMALSCPRPIPKSFHLLKVPHHTSSSADHLLQLLDISDKTIMACSTVYRNGRINLPEEELIDLYHEYTNQFLCTGCIKGSQDEEFDYGCIHVIFDLLNENSVTYLYGNANKVFENFAEPL